MQGAGFDLQLFAKYTFLRGSNKNDKKFKVKNNSHVYGFGGNDTIKSNGKKNVLLIGGAGNDTLYMNGGSGTLVGGAGKDVFKFTYSAKNKVSAVIEDFDAKSDKIVVTGKKKLKKKVKGGNIIYTDGKNFKLTLKKTTKAWDYASTAVSSKVWGVFVGTNNVRAQKGAGPLILTNGLLSACKVRAKELIQNFSHGRPDGTMYSTAVSKKYSLIAENIAAGSKTAKKTMAQWIHSPGHYQNICEPKSKYFGAGYAHSGSAYYKDYWVQLFAQSVKSKKNTLSNIKVSFGESAVVSDTLTITGKEAVNVNLGDTKNYGNIKKVDASKATGKVTLIGGSKYATLVGGSAADVLKAGKGGATLDGGKGNDLLCGGAGKDKFIFRKGYGTDTITGSGKGDIAYLYNIANIGQAKFSLSKGALSIKSTSGTDTLVVKNWSPSGMDTVVLGNGAKYLLGTSGSKVTTKRI